MRTTLTPSARISSKSARAFAGSPTKWPSASGANGPYVTPFRKNLRSPSKKNFARTRMGSSDGGAPSGTKVGTGAREEEEALGAADSDMGWPILRMSPASPQGALSENRNL